MTDDDKFFERLRRDAAQLRYEPDDDVMWSRLAARVHGRIEEAPSASQFLAAWFRPIATSFAILSLIAALSLRLVEQLPEPLTVETMIAAAEPGNDLGDAFNVE
jgi:hypothetical protein